jgi:two-component system, OmpR family, sensor histidine kinase KdpD
MNTRRRLTAIVGSATALAAATGLVYALRPIAPTLSLGVLYTLAVLTTAVLFGLGFAIAVAVASMLAFNFLFLEPVGTLTLADGRNWTALGVYVVTAIVASELATRARRRARESEQREREAELLADAAAALLQAQALDEIHERAAVVLRGGDPVARARFDSALESLQALAAERERLDTLQRSDAIKTAVLQSVSHDFRTPLATIFSAAEGLQSAELTLTELDRASLLETIRLETARLIRLVENLLDLSRLQVGAAAPHLALWPVDELIDRAVAEVREPDRVNVTIGDALPPASVDDVQIQRVLVNLIENALKFSRATVEIIARLDARSVVIEVLDRGGAGAPGAGIGLSIARGFATLNHASIALEPRPGGGMAARLDLPRDVGSTESPESEAPALPALERR